MNSKIRIENIEAEKEKCYMQVKHGDIVLMESSEGIRFIGKVYYDKLIEIRDLMSDKSVATSKSTLRVNDVVIDDKIIAILDVTIVVNEQHIYEGDE